MDKRYLFSMMCGYGLTCLCLALLCTLYIQRYTALPEERLYYEISAGTRVIIDLRNGRVMERLRPEKIKAEEQAPAHSEPVSSPEEPAAPEEKEVVETSQQQPDYQELLQAATSLPPIYAKPAKDTDFRYQGKPVLAIILKGVGMNATSTEKAIAMPEAVTIGFSPYAPSLSARANKASEQGHDVLLHLPMEAGDLSRHDPGPYSLLTGLSADENLRRLSIVSALTVRYAGVYSDANENFSVTPGALQPVMQELSSRRIPMVYGGGYTRLSFFQQAERTGYPVIGADMHIDSAFDAETVKERFLKILSRAKERGHAVVMVAPYPVTLQMLNALLPLASKEGVLLKPVSYFFEKLYVEQENGRQEGAGL